MAKTKKILRQLTIPFALLAVFFDVSPMSFAAEGNTAMVSLDNGNTAANAVDIPKPDQQLPDNEDWAIHAQLTNITQKHNDFYAQYNGPQSLSPNGPAEETTDATLMIGRRLWNGSEVWINPEIDQGYGFNDTLGIAGFPNGGAYKLGANTPYIRVPRLFIRQVISLIGEKTDVEAGPNQLASNIGMNNVTITAGKFSVTDIFDTNSYAHDPRADFLNWSVIDAGSYDYGADPWGFTWGGAVEWTQDWWTLRGGFFQLSPQPNGKIVRINFGGNSTNLELETRHTWAGHPGKFKLLAWIDQGKMASYQDAILLGQETNSFPEVALVRRYSSRPGVVLNAEQELSSDVGAFLRLSADRGDKETYEFTDINQSLSAGLSIKGNSWGRRDDTIGIAGVLNRISGEAQSYFEAGGLGLLIGDGRLNYAPEKIAEVYYAWHPLSYASITFDYQQVSDPAYNQDRGPVSIYGVRFHANF
jgi:high affinity Mn2+ porin